MRRVVPGGRSIEPPSGITESVRDSDVARDLGPIKMSGSVHDQGFPVLLKHLLLQKGDSGGVADTVGSPSWIATKDADSHIGRQPRIDVTDGCEELGVHWRLPDARGRSFRGLPDLLELGS